MLQGMTAHYLAHSTFALRAGHTALVHAGAGGVGRLLIQMAKRAGARVFATAGTEAKARVAREAGADETIVYTEADFAEAVGRLTDQQGVDVVYDSVGQATFEKSLDCLKPRGMLALFGASSGPVPPLAPPDPECQGLAVPHPPEPDAPHADPGRNRVARGPGA